MFTPIFNPVFGSVIGGDSPLQRVLALFGAGDAGVAFVPGIGSLTSAVGTIDEAGVGDPVGFQLDLSQGAGFAGGAFTGLGPDLRLTSMSFISADASWTDNGDGSFTSSGSTGNLKFNTAPLNTFFEIRIEVDAGASGTFSLTRNIGPVSFTGAGVKSAVAYVFNDNNEAWINGNGFTGTIRNIQFIEIPGNHAYQTVDAGRPTLAQADGRKYLSFDYVDDNMSFNSSYLVGTEVTTTVAFSTPTVPDGNNQGFVFGSADASVGSNMHIGRSNATQVRFGTYADTALATLAWDDSPLVLSGKLVTEVGRVLRYNGSAVGTTGTANLVTEATENLLGGYRAFNSRLHMYGTFIIDRNLPANELTLVEEYFASLSGVTL